MELLKITHDINLRLDAYILKNFPSLSIALLHKYLRENKIKVNGVKMPLSYRLIKGDEIKLFLPYKKNENLAFQKTQNELVIVFENSELLIIQKPSGLVSESDNEQNSLINYALSYLNKKNEVAHTIPNFIPCLCHRLDTGTSGLIILAKTPSSEKLITTLIKEHSITKEYLGVTFGRPSPSDGKLVGWLKKDSQNSFVSITLNQRANAKEVITQYKTEAVSGPLALLKIKLVTGRTHQIRAHFSSIGCPLLGDGKYGNNSANRAHKVKYQLLCAYSIKFPDNKQLSEDIRGKTFYADKPWFYDQILSGELK